MLRIPTRTTILALAVMALIPHTTTAQAPEPMREIVNLTGDLYRARNNNAFTVFLVTPEGIVLGDPLGVPFAEWLKTELARRFDAPVRYVIYSHSHHDRSEGGAVFADTARFVAHENMLANMDGRIPQMPGDILDRNNNGRFEMEEFRGPLLNNRCGIGNAPRFDLDGDGSVTPAEYYAQIVPPDIVYSERMRLDLGGKTVELIHPGKNHANDTTVALYLDERVAFTSGFIVEGGTAGGLRRWPAACGTVPGFDSHPLAEWIRSFKTVEAMDFDLLINGHQDVRLTQSDVAEHRRFYEELVATIRAGMSEGKSLEELKQTLLFEQYADWEGYEARRVWTIEAAYHNLKTYR